MDKKYVQKVIPRVSTERYRKLPPYELRKEIHRLCDLWQGKDVYNEHIGITIQVRGYRRKTAYGEAAYSKKAAVVECLLKLLQYARYNNFGVRKTTDPANIIGLLQFQGLCGY